MPEPHRTPFRFHLPSPHSYHTSKRRKLTHTSPSTTTSTTASRPRPRFLPSSPTPAPRLPLHDNPFAPKAGTDAFTAAELPPPPPRAQHPPQAAPPQPPHASRTDAPARFTQPSPTRETGKKAAQFKGAPAFLSSSPPPRPATATGPPLPSRSRFSHAADATRTLDRASRVRSEALAEWFSPHRVRHGERYVRGGWAEQMRATLMDVSMGGGRLEGVRVLMGELARV